MAKLKLIPEPTFKAKVPVPVEGAGTVDTEFTFKHRARDEMERFLSTVRENPEMPDHELVMHCAVGWELADPFNEENVKEFARQYMAGPTAVFETYCAEVTGARRKNFVRPQS